MKDILLEKFFENERWEEALQVGVNKDIDLADLRQLAKPEIRAAMYKAMVEGNYEIAPPHQALIPKDNGEFRTVYVNENIDRIVLSIINNLLFEMFPHFVHSSCKSYQKGIGCGKIVKEVSEKIVAAHGKTAGWKSDLSKYFDSVPIKFIDSVFDRIEEEVGKSAIIDVVRKYYHTDLCFDTDGNLIAHYQSLKQGCAIASFLADAMLYHIDEALSNMNGFYVRYSDDCLFLGPDYELAMSTMKSELEKMQMTLNPKKVEYLSDQRWFKFLGFAIKGSQISLSKSRIKSFQKEIEKRTIKNRKATLKGAVNAVMRYLYIGDGEYSWATQVLGTINNVHDINLLNMFVMDALRAVQTGKGRIGGLGYVPEDKKGVIARGTGKNVKANRGKTEKNIDGYISLTCAQNALRTSKAAYAALVRCT